MGERDQFRLLQDFLMKEEEIRAFMSEEDTKNIAEIAPIMKIGSVEFEEKPGEGAMRNGRRPRVESFYKDDPDLYAMPVIWERETFAGTRIRFVMRPKKGVTWDDAGLYLVQKCLAGFAMIKKSAYLVEGFRYTVTHDAAFGSKNLNFGEFLVTDMVRSGQIIDYAVFFMNVNGTGEMNNQIGRSNGTLVMRLFLKRLESILEEPEAVWRIGGDNIGALVRKSNVDRFLELIQGTYITFGSSPEEQYRISATAGICPGSSEFHKTSEVIDAAQSCMNMAKFVRHVPYLYYDKQMVQMLENARHVEMAFPDAIANEEFRVYYQPKVSLLTNEVIGAEALCRWIRGGEVITPDRFVPVLERSRLICDLDMYMLDHACRDIRAWLDAGGIPVEVSSNFSRKHLNNPYLSRQIVQTIDKYNVPHELIIVELTETTSTVHMKQMGELVYKLKDEGIRTSVDDFGMGYSSMSMLRDIPFSELKIDRSFLTYTTDTRDRSAIMMKHVISMATELGMRCIAEGVETPDQIKMLKDMDCFRAQGFFFDKPLPREEFESRLRKGKYTERPVQ